MIQRRFCIRDARAEDRGAIRALTLAAYAEYATIMTPTAWAGLRQALLAGLEAGGAVERIVAEQDGTLIGSVMLYSPSANAYGDAVAGAGWPELRLLAVAAMARGQGVGTALVEECTRRARDAGANALGLHTSESLKAAIHMYERMGFVRAPAGDFQPSGAELVMAYQLPLDGD
ncbi:MAG: GNAT family N-acetyltransferase [Roseiflexaceae bacterium]